MQKKFLIILIIIIVIIIIAAIFYLFYQKEQKEPEPYPSMISTSGLITQIEYNTIFLERYMSNAIDKEIIKVKVTNQTIIRKITYRIDPRATEFFEHREGISEEEMEMLKQVHQRQEEIINFSDLKIGDDIETQSAKDISGQKEFTAIEIRVVAEETIP